MKTRVKICGIRTPEVASIACAAGADALGFVFYAKSPRAVTAEQAGQITKVVSPFVTAVGLFVNPSADEVETVLRRCDLDLLQFHGDEDATFCERFERPYIKAVRVSEATDFAQVLSDHPSARAFLLDTDSPRAPGGTGEVFDWDLIPDLHRPWILAGGLTPANVGQCVAQLKPPAVDVSGGVERIKGEKDPELIQEFCAAVISADKRSYKDAAA